MTTFSCIPFKDLGIHGVSKANSYGNITYIYIYIINITVTADCRADYKQVQMENMTNGKYEVLTAQKVL